MNPIIPQNLVQCTFDFDILTDQPVVESIPPKNTVPPQKQKYCAQCKQWLSTENFCKQSSSKDGLRTICRSCRHDNYIADLARDPEFNKKRGQKQREAFLAKSPEEQDQIRSKNNQRQREARPRKKREGICTQCLCNPCEIGYHSCEQCRSSAKRFKARHPDRNRFAGKLRRDKLREQVIAAYGSVCTDCGESNPAFLSIDHISNDGGEHRRKIGGGYYLYIWLRKNGFPQEGFQLLCHNCNWLKHINHEKSDEVTYNMLYNADLRQETLAAYGNKCSCCDEVRPEVLTIDHVDGGGNDHRRVVGGGTRTYIWLRKNGFPQEGFQLLCRNCNFAKYVYGTCPHQHNTP